MKNKNIDKIKTNAFFDIIFMIERFQESCEKKNDLWRQSTLLLCQIYTAVILRDRFLDILHFTRFDDFMTKNGKKNINE